MTSNTEEVLSSTRVTTAMSGRPVHHLWMTKAIIRPSLCLHYSDVIIGAMASQINSLAIVCWTVYSGADQRKHQSSASLAFVRGIHRWPVNSSHKWPVTRKMFPFDDVIMSNSDLVSFVVAHVRQVTVPVSIQGDIRKGTLVLNESVHSFKYTAFLKRFTQNINYI